MRLLQRNSDGSVSVTEDLHENIPAYAILSHTWGKEKEEVTFRDLRDPKYSKGRLIKSKEGYRKLKFCGDQAARDGLRYFWIDTCCIDRSNAVELNEAINSMFRWYRDAAKCYVYLSDVSVKDKRSGRDATLADQGWESAFRRSRWFTRGWTLQELLAPRSVEFFSSESSRLGSRRSLEGSIHEITGIPTQALQGNSLSEFSVDDRMLWAEKRSTKREEDWAYCLLGIFDIHMPLIYGEGKEHAVARLQKEVFAQAGSDISMSMSTLTVTDKSRPKQSFPSTPKEPDALFLVPFSKDDSFIGREIILAELDEKRRQVGSWNHSRLALVGLGGIGKSQIAIEYAYRVRELDPTIQVMWIHASNATRFEQGYREFANRVSLPGRDDPQADILQLVCQWLSDKRNGQWLMIIDNADEDDVFFASDAMAKNKPLEGFLPQTPNGTILITSRNMATAVNLVGTHGTIVRVEPMNEEEALALLRTRVPFDDADNESAKALVQTLEYVPLAIIHAAAYIKTRAPITTISSYLKLFSESEANQVRLLAKDGLKDLRRDHSIRHAAIATWQISFVQIQKKEPSAADLLALMSMFDRQGIPISLLQNDSNQLDFEDAMAPLLSFSLVRTEIGKQSFEIHRLVQLSMRTWLKSNDQLAKWTKKSIKTMEKAFPNGEYKTWATCQALLPHAEEAISHETSERDDVSKQGCLALDIARYLDKRGEYDSAEKVLRKAWAKFESIHGMEDQNTICSINNLGLVLEKMGKYEEAEQMHRRALKAYEKLLGPEHVYTLTSISNLGLALARQKDKFAEAEEVSRRALIARERIIGADHPDTLDTVNNLGIALEGLGKDEEAEAMDVRALEGKEKQLGPEHPDTLRCINNLGYMYVRKGDYEEGKAMHQKALKGREKVLGYEHPDTLGSVFNLAYAHHQQGEYEAAIKLYERACSAYKRRLGPNHPTTIACISNYEWVLQEVQRAERRRNV